MKYLLTIFAVLLLAACGNNPIIQSSTKANGIGLDVSPSRDTYSLRAGAFVRDDQLVPQETSDGQPLTSVAEEFDSAGRVIARTEESRTAVSLGNSTNTTSLSLGFDLGGDDVSSDGGLTSGTAVGEGAVYLVKYAACIKHGGPLKEFCVELAKGDG